MKKRTRIFLAILMTIFVLSVIWLMFYIPTFWGYVTVYDWYFTPYLITCIVIVLILALYTLNLWHGVVK